jgi:hypothetical protein
MKIYFYEYSLFEEDFDRSLVNVKEKEEKEEKVKKREEKKKEKKK